MNTSLECIRPEEIAEGDLMAFVDGTANRRVARHVAECAHCAARVAEYRALALAATLHRASCPASEALGDFHLNLLPPGQKLVVAKHLRECALCRQELAQYAENAEPFSSATSTFPNIAGAFRSFIAALYLAPPLQPATLRGAPGRRQEFRVGENSVVIGYQPSGLCGRLVGVIDPWPPAANLAPGFSVRVQLFQEEMPVGEQTTDELGHFVFDEVAPGRYDLLVDWLDDVVLIADVEAL